MRIYGRSKPDFVRFDEGPTALATRFAADEAVSAALAAGGTVAADLWEQRTGETQSVDVSTREAAASLTSYTFVRIEDPKEAPPRARPLGAAQRRDGVPSDQGRPPCAAASQLPAGN